VRRAVLVALAASWLVAGCISGPAERAPDVHLHGLKVETRLGSFTAILFEDDTPATSAFFSKLVAAKYYDGRAFGRVIPGFVIQEVDRTGGTTDQTEHVKLEAGTRVMFSAGALGIARDADPDSGGSEFFVMDFATSTLYRNFTAFAQVVDGMDVVHAIARVPAVKTGPASSVGAPLPVALGVHDRVPIDPVAMTRVMLVDVPLSAAEAARYPLRVGETTRTDTMRLTLQWPADLRAGATSTLEWHVATRDPSPQGQVQDPPPPDLRGAVVVIGDERIAPTEDASHAPGLLRFAWTPRAPGAFVVALAKDGATLAATNVTVT
jgi:cyclophilin family peptidyl-prolyl cis-trans isomerase